MLHSLHPIDQYQSPSLGLAYCRHVDMIHNVNPSKPQNFFAPRKLRGMAQKPHGTIQTYRCAENTAVHFSSAIRKLNMACTSQLMTQEAQLSQRNRAAHNVS